jgi:transcription antitermination factor NusG
VYARAHALGIRGIRGICGLPRIPLASRSAGVLALTSVGYTTQEPGDLVRATYWALAKTKRSEEERAASHVERQGFAYWLPRMIEWSSSGGQKFPLMFPGYIFFKVRQGWQALCSTRGIASVVICQDEPARVRQSEIDYLRSLENARGLVVLPARFGDGDAVRVAQGSYAGARGVVRGMPAAGRCAVLLQMFGKEVSLDVGEESLESA